MVHELMPSELMLCSTDDTMPPIEMLTAGGRMFLRLGDTMIAERNRGQWCPLIPFLEIKDTEDGFAIRWTDAGGVQ